VYGFSGNVARHSVVFPDCRGPVTVTTGNFRAREVSFGVSVRRITAAGLPEWG